MKKSFLYTYDSEIFSGELYKYIIPTDNDLQEILSKCDLRNPSSFKRYYLHQYNKYKVNKPLLGFDYLLEGISEGALEKNMESSGYLLRSLFTCAENRTIDETEIQQTKWDDVFKTNFWKSRNGIRNAALLLLRIACNNCENLVRASNSISRTIDLFKEVLPDIAKNLRINHKRQTFEQLQQWKDFGKGLSGRWKSLDIDNVENYEKQKENINSIFATLRRDYLFFVNFKGIESFPNMLFSEIDIFNDAINADNLLIANNTTEKLKRLLKTILDDDSYYIRYYVIPLIQKALEYFCHRLGEFNKPAHLKISPIERKYAFFDKEASIVLRLMIKNDGGGFANDIKLEIEFDPHVIVSNEGSKTFSNYWGELRPGSISLDIPITIEEPFEGSLCGIYELTWRDWEKQCEPQTDILEFKCEMKRVNWKVLENTQRYSIEPVRKDEDFIGKESRVTPIVSDIVTNLGSAWLYGQRRIGKTSTLLGVKRELKRSKRFLVANTTYGEFSHDDHKTVIDQLVKRIATNLNKEVNDSIELPAPNGSLSPLFEFLEKIHSITGKSVFFMIDEIDELPYVFYESSNAIAQPFWQTLRSISLCEYAGFLLVGGENVKKLKTEWGGTLNLLNTHSVDRFVENEWEDYRHLITSPVEVELDFTDDSIQELYRITNGTPFFTKLICKVIQSEACQVHNSFISNIEINKAVHEAVSSVMQMDSFQHFIEDGLKGKDTEINERKKSRAKFLFCISKLLGSKNSVQKEELKKDCISSSINEESYDDLLNEFRERGILIINDDNIEFCMPLFRLFLKARGEIELPRFFRIDVEHKKQLEIEEKLRVKSNELKVLATNWGVYQGNIIEPSRIEDWILQFDDIANQREVFEFLKKICFVKRDQIIEELSYAFKLAVKDIVYQKGFKKRKRNDVFISYLDGPGKSGAWIANQFKEVNEILKANLLELSKLQEITKEENNPYNNMKVLVLVDDFVCTGHSLSSRIEENQEMLKTLTNKFNVKVLLFVAYGFESGREKILQNVTNIEVHFGNIFDEKEKIFSEQSRYFSSEEKRGKMEKILVDNYGVKVDSKFPKGYNDSEVAIVFPENCPNNSLPILWMSKQSWKPLFPRITG